jgi:hypothetical protein
VPSRRCADKKKGPATRLTGIVKDATGEYVMGFVFLVAFAWLCAGQALAVSEPRARPASA